MPVRRSRLRKAGLHAGRVSTAKESKYEMHPKAIASNTLLEAIVFTTKS